jgi:hypothetical protein
MKRVVIVDKDGNEFKLPAVLSDKEAELMKQDWEGAGYKVRVEEAW